MIDVENLLRLKTQKMAQCRADDKVIDGNDTGLGTVSIDENNLSEDGTITRLGEEGDETEDYHYGRIYASRLLTIYK